MAGDGGANEACLGKRDSYHDGSDLGVRLEERLFEHLKTGVRDLHNGESVERLQQRQAGKQQKPPEFKVRRTSLWVVDSA
jgi:hypothetical protein